jgi:YebC/PmpR family DNA-binding regulatory protein
MSGHSKWSTIKRKKGALDAKRSKSFSRITKEITVAVKEGGIDPLGNPRLRLAIQNAKGVNMPKDNIQRAISKANNEGVTFTEITFEGYGPGGVAIFIEALTENNNRTVSNVRALFSKKGGNLGTNGSLSFIFDRKGVFTIKAGNINIEELELELIDAGLESSFADDEEVVLYTLLEDFGNMQKKLESLKIEVENSELRRIPSTTKQVDVDTAKKVLKLVEAFEDDDDIQNVFHNLELTDEIEQALQEE